MTQEFKVTRSKEQTVYTLESATGGSTSAGNIASMDSELGGMQRRNPPGDNILAQESDKKKDAPKPRNFVAKNAKMGGAGKMQDKSKTIPRKEKHKKPVAESFNHEYDDEAGMAQSNLLTTARAVIGLLKTIKDRDNLPEWGQEKIAKAEMMLVSIWDYLQSQKAMGNNPQQGVAEGKEDKIKQLKADHATAVHWSKNETSPQKREAARQKAEKIKRHLDTQYKQGVAETDAYVESLTNMLERSVSQAQHNLMVGVAHNPAFAQKVKVKQKVGQEFANADQGHDISKLPIRVPKKK